MSFVVVIPARLNSTRLKEKLLAKINDKEILLHVLAQVKKSNAERIVVATDSKKIYQLVTAAGFEALMTSACHTGSERVARAVKKLKLTGIVINVQGDIPEVKPVLINALANEIKFSKCEVATAVAKITPEMAKSDATVKVVIDNNDNAIYFSRSLIPYDGYHDDYLGHIGIYAFAPNKVLEASKLTLSYLEAAESLEQLTWLANGWKIATVSVDEFIHGIDTKEDLLAAQARMSNND